MELSAQGITLSLEGKTIVRNASLSLPTGKVTILAGLNGAGKTTLLRAFAGLLRPAEGQLLCDGRDLYSVPQKERAKWVAYLAQRDEAVSAYPAEEFILLGAAPHLGFWEQPGQKERARVRQEMERLHIFALRKKPVNRMSGGERQLCRLAQALVQDADCLLLDEPAAPLDYLRQREFFELLHHQAHDEGKAVALTVHDPNLVLTYADRVALLQEGRILTVLDREGSGALFYPLLLKSLREVYGERLSLASAGSGMCAYWKEEPECLP